MTDDTTALIAELQRLFEQSATYQEPGATLREICRATGKSEDSIRRKLQNLAQDGKIIAVRTMRPSVLTGDLHFTYVYRPTNQGGEVV